MTPSGKSLPRRMRSSAMMALLSAVLICPAVMAADDASSLEDKYFEAVFADPTNLILNFKLAGAQLENGNIKGAIGTLERVLTLSPNNNQAQFLIASAHLQIGNTAEARRMFTLLIENPDASEVEVNQARGILAGLDRQSRMFNISGSLSAGAGLADNPEGGSQGNLSEVSGSIVASSASFTKRALTEEFTTAGAAVNFQRKLESQNAESVMVSLSTSTKDFAHYNAGDLATVGLSARYLRGVESTFGKGMLNTSISTSRVHIDDKHYLNSYGINGGYSQTIYDRWNANVNLGVNRSVFKKSFSATSSLKTARNTTAGLRLARAFKNVQLGGKYSFASSMATAKYNSKKTHSAGVFASTNIFPGITTLGLDVSHADHKEAETIYSDEKRKDRTQTVNMSYVLGLSSLNAPVGNEARLSIASKYGKTKSNIANFTKYAGEISMNFIKPF